MTIGVILTAYNMADLLPKSLPAWVAARRASLGGHTFKIVAVCCPFVGFPQPERLDDTEDILCAAAASGDIDLLITSSKPITEIEARGRALAHLRGIYGVDILWQWDADERSTVEDILRIATYVEQQPYVSAFRVSYRNLVFDEQHYLAEPFTPMRIHRVHAPGMYDAMGFWDDNNVYYQKAVPINDNDVVRDIELASVTIPPNVAAPLHDTWRSNERSKLKVAYQHARWGHCSFRWDEQRGLCFDEGYYAKRGLPLPEVVSV